MRRPSTWPPPTATRVTIDETGLPFEGIEELALAPWHSCARKDDVLFCWGQRFSGAQAEPPSAIGPDRTRPRAIGNLDVVRIAADGPHTCALKTNGRHVCFGHSALNELGRSIVQITPKNKDFKKPLWRVKHSKLTFMIDGKERHLDIAEMTAWRGAWYVTRLR